MKLLIKMVRKKKDRTMIILGWFFILYGIFGFVSTIGGFLLGLSVSDLYLFVFSPVAGLISIVLGLTIISINNKGGKK